MKMNLPITGNSDEPSGVYSNKRKLLKKNDSKRVIPLNETN